MTSDCAALVVTDEPHEGPIEEDWTSDASTPYALARASRIWAVWAESSDAVWMRTESEPTRVTLGAPSTRPVEVTACEAKDSLWSATCATSNWEPPVNSIERFRPRIATSAKPATTTAAANPTKILRLGTTA